MEMTHVIGLTGGIATGKSMVSAYLRKQGHAVIDADQVVHDLQAKKGKLYKALLAAFGPTILQEDGELDRPKLAQLIFSSPEKQVQSAQLQDTLIREELASELERLKDDHDLVFLDIPLLFEKGYESWCDEVWLIVVDEATQLQRLMSRNVLTREQALQRMASQMPQAEKIKRADRLIDNSGLLEDTYQQIDRLLALLDR